MPGSFPAPELLTGLETSSGHHALGQWEKEGPSRHTDTPKLPIPHPTGTVLC